MADQMKSGVAAKRLRKALNVLQQAIDRIIGDFGRAGAGRIAALIDRDGAKSGRRGARFLIARERSRAIVTQ